MSKAARPWMKWYPADWRSDPGLRSCSYAARGLWADMLALMHESEPYGHLLVSGRPPAQSKLAAILGGTAREIERLMGELRDALVFSTTDEGVIFSRRMVRDKQIAERDELNGKGGGNPRLRGADNPGVNPPDKAQKPEARDQKETPEAIASAPQKIPAEERPRGKRAKPRTALDPDRQPDSQDRAFAAERSIDTDAEWPKFMANNLGRGVLSADWHANWRTWCLNEPRFSGPVGNGSGRGGDGAAQLYRKLSGELWRLDEDEENPDVARIASQSGGGQVAD